MPGGLIQDGARLRVTRFGRAGHGRGRNGLRFPARQGQDAGARTRTFVQQFPGPKRDGRTGGHRLQAPPAPAAAARAAGHHGDVPDLARSAAHPAVDLPPQDEPAADSGADGDVHQFVAVSPRAESVLAKGAEVRVVLEAYGELKARLQVGPQGRFFPAQVGRLVNDPGIRVKRSGRPDPHSPDIFRFHASLCCDRDHRVRDLVQNGFVSPPGRGRYLRLSRDRAFHRGQQCVYFGAAQVHPDYVSGHVPTPLPMFLPVAPAATCRARTVRWPRPRRPRRWTP